MITIFDGPITRDEYFALKPTNFWFALFCIFRHTIAIDRPTTRKNLWKLGVRCNFQVRIDKEIRNEIFILTLTDGREKVSIKFTDPLVHFSPTPINNFKVTTSSLDFAEYIEVMLNITQ